MYNLFNFYRLDKKAKFREANYEKEVIQPLMDESLRAYNGGINSNFGSSCNFSKVISPPKRVELCVWPDTIEGFVRPNGVKFSSHEVLDVNNLISSVSVQ